MIPISAKSTLTSIFSFTGADRFAEYGLEKAILAETQRHKPRYRIIAFETTSRDKNKSCQKPLTTKVIE
jgi:hypothetical protein